MIRSECDRCGRLLPRRYLVAALGQDGLWCDVCAHILGYQQLRFVRVDPSQWDLSIYEAMRVATIEGSPTEGFTLRLFTATGGVLAEWPYTNADTARRDGVAAIIERYQGEDYGRG